MSGDHVNALRTVVRGHTGSSLVCSAAHSCWIPYSTAERQNELMSYQRGDWTQLG